MDELKEKIMELTAFEQIHGAINKVEEEFKVIVAEVEAVVAEEVAKVEKAIESI